MSPPGEIISPGGEIISPAGGFSAVRKTAEGRNIIRPLRNKIAPHVHKKTIIGYDDTAAGEHREVLGKNRSEKNPVKMHYFACR